MVLYGGSDGGAEALGCWRSSLCRMGLWVASGPGACPAVPATRADRTGRLGILEDGQI